MAWEREGGDKNHTNGVHFEKEAWTKAIKERQEAGQGRPDHFHRRRTVPSMYSVDVTRSRRVHDAAEAALQEIHTLGIHQADERAAAVRGIAATATNFTG